MKYHSVFRRISVKDHLCATAFLCESLCVQKAFCAKGCACKRLYVQKLLYWHAFGMRVSFYIFLLLFACIQHSPPVWVCVSVFVSFNPNFLLFFFHPCSVWLNNTSFINIHTIEFNCKNTKKNRTFLYAVFVFWSLPPQAVGVRGWGVDWWVATWARDLWRRAHKEGKEGKEGGKGDVTTEVQILLQIVAHNLFMHSLPIPELYLHYLH